MPAASVSAAAGHAGQLAARKPRGMRVHRVLRCAGDELIDRRVSTRSGAALDLLRLDPAVRALCGARPQHLYSWCENTRRQSTLRAR